VVAPPHDDPPSVRPSQPIVGVPFQFEQRVSGGAGNLQGRATLHIPTAQTCLAFRRRCLSAWPLSERPPRASPFPQINCRRLAALGLGEVSPEAVAARRKGQHFTREGMGGLMKKVRGAAGGLADGGP
jgi:hypothetical protein